jgi:hypothetical protein
MTDMYMYLSHRVASSDQLHIFPGVANTVKSELSSYFLQCP